MAGASSFFRSRRLLGIRAFVHIWSEPTPGMQPIGRECPALTTRVVVFGVGRDPDMVPVKPTVPAALRRGPLTLEEANRSGVTRSQLRGASYRRLGAGLYRWVGLDESPHLMLSAVARRLPVGAAFSGLTAAWLHGLDVAPCDPIEVTIPKPFGSDRRSGASVRRVALVMAEVVVRRGLPTTSPLRTVVDLGSRNPLTEGVVATDLFLHTRLVSIAQLQAYVDEHRGAKGIARFVESLISPRRAPNPRWRLGCGCSLCFWASAAGGPGSNQGRSRKVLRSSRPALSGSALGGRI